MGRGEDLDGVRGVPRQRDGQREPSAGAALRREQAASTVDATIEPRRRSRAPPHADRWLVREYRERIQFRSRRREEAEDPARGPIGDVEIAGGIEPEPLWVIEPSGEQADSPVRMQLRDRTPRSLSVGAELLGRQEQRPQPILRQRRRPREATGESERPRGARARAGQDRNLEYGSVRHRLAAAAVGRRVEDSIAGHDAPKGSEAVGEDRERSRWREGQDRLGLGRFVVRLGVGAARQPTGGDEHGPVFRDVEPPRLLDSRHQGRARAVALQPRDPARSLLGDEQSPFGIEGEPDRPLEPAGHDGHGLIRSDARDRPGKTVGDEDDAVNIHSDAAGLEKSARPDAGRRQRYRRVSRDARCVRRGRQQHQETQADEPEGARNARLRSDRFVRCSRHARARCSSNARRRLDDDADRESTSRSSPRTRPRVLPITMGRPPITRDTSGTAHR